MKLYCVVIFAVLAALFSGRPATADDLFPDKNLEAALRAVLLEPKGELTEAQLGNVFVLEAKGKNIANLSGLEKCKNLALLRVTKNEISDLKPLKDLTNLQSLDLENNKVADVTPLAGLTKLQYLHLAGVAINSHMRGMRSIAVGVMMIREAPFGRDPIARQILKAHRSAARASEPVVFDSGFRRCTVEAPGRSPA